MQKCNFENGLLQIEIALIGKSIVDKEKKLGYLDEAYHLYA
jgi:hypothetical protein